MSRALHPRTARSSLLASALVACVAALAGCGSDYAIETQPISSGGGWTFTDDTSGATSGGGPFGRADSGRATDTGSRRGQDSGASQDVGAASGSDTAGTGAGSDATNGQPDVALADVADAEDAAGGADCPMPCDDGLTCTVDACKDGACVYTPVAGVCVIDGACVMAGASPPGKPCAVCDPAATATAWSNKPACCGKDSDCTPAGVCDAPVCEVATGTCKANKKVGCCQADAECDDANKCTIDTCDKSTGDCKISPKVCTDASTCQAGLCDPGTGQCGQQLKAGWCLIGGSCVTAGTLKPNSACERCEPTSQTAMWTAKVGAPCDDGDSCTASDACDAKGGCVGTPLKGCCKSHLDCAWQNSACTTATCDIKAGVCIVATQPGCCESGACCDLASNTTKPKGTLCSGNIVGTEYRCSGQAVEKRDIYPGCAGVDAKTCSSDAQYAYKGPWTGVKTCGGDTVCSQAASGVMPTCKPKEPTGTCKGACGGPAADGTCSCGPSCVTLGTCCKDYSSTCACTSGGCCDTSKKFLKPKGAACGGGAQYQCSGQTIQKRTSSATCTGTSATCPAGGWSAWSTVQTCGSGTTCTVAANKASASCKPTGGGGSCVGKCGQQSGSCWCDSKCVTYGDCCGDYAAVCGGNACGANPASSCKGKCGGQGAGGCWCDSNCVILGDCCKDKTVCCP